MLASIDCHGVPLLKPHFPLSSFLCRFDRHFVKKNRGVVAVAVMAAAAVADYCCVDAVVVVLAADNVS